MASPQKENGYTMIANELMESLARYKFPPKASLPPRICLVVIRKTYGFHKKMDRISLSQFQLATNEKNRTNLCYWLKYLVQAKILVKNELKNGDVEYGLNKDYDSWLPLVQVRALVSARKYGSASIDTKSSASNDTHKRKKETITKEIAGTSPAIPLVIELFKDINPAYKKWYGNTTQRKAVANLLERNGFEQLQKVIALLPKTNKMQYLPTITTPLQLEDKWASLEAGLTKEKNKLKANYVGVA